MGYGYPSDQSMSAGAIPVWITAGGSPIVPVPPTPPPATIAGSGSYNSGVMVAGGAPGLAVTATLTQAGTMTVQRYIDKAGTIPIGIAVEQDMTASTPAWISLRDGLVFASWSVVIANTSGSVGTLSNVAFLEAA